MCCINIDLNEIILIELKTTKKKLLNFPSGFFFGVTENELNLAEMLGSKFKFCFLSLFKGYEEYTFMTYTELNKRIRDKRIQYQVNLK